MNRIPVNEAPLTLDVTLAVFSVKLPHDDPADRFLVASAKVFELILVTSDRHLLTAEGISVLAN
jgi:PIN domain nuclease of toxin-antitoxin system